MAQHSREHHVLTNISIDCTLIRSQLHIYEDIRPDYTFLELAKKYLLKFYFIEKQYGFHKRNLISSGSKFKDILHIFLNQ